MRDTAVLRPGPSRRPCCIFCRFELLFPSNVYRPVYIRYTHHTFCPLIITCRQCAFKEASLRFGQFLAEERGLNLKRWVRNSSAIMASQWVEDPRAAQKFSCLRPISYDVKGSHGSPWHHNSTSAVGFTAAAGIAEYVCRP